MWSRLKSKGTGLGLLLRLHPALKFYASLTQRWLKGHQDWLVGRASFHQQKEHQFTDGYTLIRKGIVKVLDGKCMFSVFLWPSAQMHPCSSLDSPWQRSFQPSSFTNRSSSSHSPTLQSLIHPPCADTTLSNLSEFCSFCSYTTVYSCQYTYYFFLRREKVKTKTIFHINYLLKKYLLFDIRNCVSRSHLHSKIQSRCRVYAVFIIPFNQTQHEEI